MDSSQRGDSEGGEQAGVERPSFHNDFLLFLWVRGRYYAVIPDKETFRENHGYALTLKHGLLVGVGPSSHGVNMQVGFAGVAAVPNTTHMCHHHSDSLTR